MFRFIPILFLLSCATIHKRDWPRASTLTGSAYYRTAAAYGWEQRDSLSREAILSGNMPEFLRRFKTIHVQATDSLTGKSIRLTYWVAPDYLSVGSSTDWARIHITPKTAQRIADSLHCFLPTRKMVDQIYHSAKVKLEPVPMYAFRDSTPTFWQHHLIVEGERKGQKDSSRGSKKILFTPASFVPILSRTELPFTVGIVSMENPFSHSIPDMSIGTLITAKGSD